MCSRGKAPGDGSYIAHEYKGTVGSQVLRYSSPGMLQMKDRCEANFKDMQSINNEIYCRLKEYITETQAKPLIVLPPFCLCS